jgi:hypothetical protein
MLQQPRLPISRFSKPVNYQPQLPGPNTTSLCLRAEAQAQPSRQQHIVILLACQRPAVVAVAEI